MTDLLGKGPLADGGYPADSDLHQMSDDGCPLTPDPARWSDPEWRDDPAEGEASGDDRRDDPGPGVTGQAGHARRRFHARQPESR